MHKRYAPFILTLLVILIDQISKAWIVSAIAENTVGYSFFGGWLEIIHVRNNAVAFSMGSSFPNWLKVVLFIILPIAVMGVLVYVLVRRRWNFTDLQYILLGGILGGGLGNIIDRIFRSFRVVDFISTDMNGFLGMSRFPTWNVADGTLVVCTILLLITVLFTKEGKKK